MRNLRLVGVAAAGFFAGLFVNRQYAKRAKRRSGWARNITAQTGEALHDTAETVTGAARDAAKNVDKRARRVKHSARVAARKAKRHVKA